MIIGLYDIDLWHRGRAVPNLELMQYYAYYHKRNDRVVLMKPTDEESQFAKIIYFKENPNVLLPKALQVFGDNKEFTGYGFYKKNEKLPPEIEVPPSYIPYDPWVNKLGISAAEFEKMKHNSYVRIETENFVDFKKDAMHIYIADKDPLNVKGALEFIDEHKNKRFNFLHTPILNDEATALSFMRYRALFNKNCVINFHCSEDFFCDYYESVIFKLDKFDKETEEQYQKRIAKMAIWYKGHNAALRFPYNVKYSPFTEKIIIWAKDNSAKDSFATFYQSSKITQKELAALPSGLRLLLKQNPKTATRQNLDLKSSL